MFKKWIEIFKKDTLLDRAFKRSYEMLDLTRDMFIKSRESLRQMEDCQIDINVRDKDLEINKYEREVRRDVFNHLAVRGTFNLPSGLALISIIIDIERLGDYSKNMVELAKEHPGKLTGGKFEEEIKKIGNDVTDQFDITKHCLENDDPVEGKAQLEKYFYINKACDRLVYALVREEDPNIRAGDAVALGLYIRWLKRINSHLRNITTSIVNPFDRIGFEPKKETD
ncbi:MAG: PhoU domain-containing protein [Candidatus Aminicenantes bacterium]|nr:PhoU domain-containing protein [Candidatus Aminicenantes bacterium]